MAERDAKQFLSEHEPSAHLDIGLSFGGGYSITISGVVKDGTAEAVGKHFEERLGQYLAQNEELTGARTSCFMVPMGAARTRLPSTLEHVLKKNVAFFCEFDRIIA